MTFSLFTGKSAAASWADTANWKGGVAPGITDTALFLNGANSTQTGTFSVNNIMTLGDVALTIQGTVDTLGTGFCTGFMVCDGASATFAPGSTLNDPNGALLAGVDEIGTVVARGTALAATHLTTANATIGKFAGGLGTVTIDHASWSNSTVIFLGGGGGGRLNVIDGGQVYVGGNLAMGMWQGGTGTATLASGGDMTVAGAVSIGGPGTGGSPGTGTLTVNAGSVFDVKNAMNEAAGGKLTLAGGVVSVGDTHAWFTVGAGAVAEGHGVLTTRTGGMFADNGTVAADGGTLRIDGVVVGTGTMQIDAKSTLSLTSAHVMLPALIFAGADATLTLAHGAAVTGLLDGFTFGDQIAMAGIDAATWSSTTGDLTLTSAGTTVDKLHLAGSYAGDIFSVTQSGGIGVIGVHLAPPH